MNARVCIEIVSARLSAREDDHIECSSINGIYRCIWDDTDLVGTCNRTGKKSGQNASISALRSMSTTVSASISSKPCAIGIRTFAIYSSLCLESGDSKPK